MFPLHPRRVHRRPHVATVALVLLVVALSPTEADWPQHRGPQRDGWATGSPPIAPWGTDGPIERWRREIGDGFSGLSVVGDGLFTLFADGPTELAGRFDAATGAEIWRTPLGPRFEDSWGDGPRSTPTVVDGTVYALGSYGSFAALDASDGSVRWQIDLATLREAAEPPHFGFSPSPLVVGDLVVLEVGGGPGRLIAAFARTDGTLAWSAETGRAGYASPVRLGAEADASLVFLTREAVIALAPDGRTRWRWPFGGGSPFDLPIATPVVTGPGEVFVSHRADGGSALLRVSDTSAEPQTRWTGARMLSHMNAPIHRDGVLYGFHNGTLKALTTTDAKTRWAQRGLGKGSLIGVGERLLVLGDRGQLVLVDAVADAYRERARAQIFDGITWTPPSFADGTLYARASTTVAAFVLTAPAASIASTRSAAETSTEDRHAPEPDRPSLASLLTRHAEALGGAARWATLEGYRVRGRYATNSRWVDWQLEHRRPGHWRLTRGADPGTGNEGPVTELWDGTQAWIDDPAAETEGWTALPVDDDRGRSIAADAVFDSPLLAPAADTRLRFVGPAETELGTAWEIVVTDPILGEERWFLHPETYLPMARFVRRWTWGRARALRYYFSDYRTIDGLRFPFVIEDEFSSFHRMLRIEAIELNPTFPDDAFRAPDVEPPAANPRTPPHAEP